MKLNNKGFAITTILYGTLILFLMLMLSMLGILSTYKDRMEILIESTNGARCIINGNCNEKYDDEWKNGKSGNFNVTYYKAIKNGEEFDNCDFTLNIFWKEEYNLFTNTSKVSITDMKAMSSCENMYYYGGEEPLNETDNGIFINGDDVQKMSQYIGNDYLYTTDTFKTINTSTSFPWVSSEINHNGDGTGTTQIRVYINACNSIEEDIPTCFYFDHEEMIELTDVR